VQGDPKVIEHLNKILGNELVAINQYFLHSRMYRDRGLKALAEHEYEESIDEMKHADKLTERILFLEGIPNFQERRPSPTVSRYGITCRGSCSRTSSNRRKRTWTGSRRNST
jgi:bacterioferritin (cytochrome b1)